jgi:hypothetical protein
MSCRHTLFKCERFCRVQIDVEQITVSEGTDVDDEELKEAMSESEDGTVWKLVVTSGAEIQKAVEYLQKMDIILYNNLHSIENVSYDLRKGGSIPVWFKERVCVRLLKQNNAEAVIRKVNGSMALVELVGNKTTATVRFGDVSMVVPELHDMVLVFQGMDVGVEGELVCIDCDDAILKVKIDLFKIIDFAHLAKISPDK